MKYPYERFLRFLVSRKLLVNQTLAKYRLPRAGDLWVAECRGQFRRTAPYAIVRYIDTPDAELDLTDGVLEWADAEKIGPLWRMQPEFGSQPTPDLDKGFRIFVDPYSRGLMGMMLMSRATSAEIIEVMKEQLDITLDNASIVTYRDIFWDVQLVPRTAWQPFLSAIEDDEERHFVAVGLNAPSTDVVRDQVGMDPKTADHRSILNSIIAKSYQKYVAAMEQPNPEVHDAMKWAELTLKAISTAKQSGSLGPAEGDVPLTSAERFKKMFSVVPAKTTHPTLADLRGTVGRPEKKEEKKDEKAVRK